MLEVDQAKSLVADAQSNSALLQKAQQQTENFISFLTGRNPQAIERGLSLTDHQLPPAVPPGLPSELIERRPDPSDRRSGSLI